jgi:hypothetical protein
VEAVVRQEPAAAVEQVERLVVVDRVVQLEVVEVLVAADPVVQVEAVVQAEARVLREQVEQGSLQLTMLVLAE